VKDYRKVTIEMMHVDCLRKLEAKIGASVFKITATFYGEKLYLKLPFSSYSQDKLQIELQVQLIVFSFFFPPT
jgi:hypothetical protein